MPDIAEKYNKLGPTQKILAIISTIIVAIPSSATIAWTVMNQFIDDNYVSHKELARWETNIVKSIKNIEKRSIQEKIFTILDKEIDGTITISDKKKKARLENELDRLK